MHMSAVDAAWLHMEDPTNLMMVTGLVWFDAPVDFDALRALVQEKLVDRYPPFSRRVRDHLIRRPEWEPDPHFTLDRHLHHIALPAPGDDATLRALVSDRMSTPLDPSQALWQMELVDNYNGGAALMMRFHHSMGDGYAMMRVLLSLATGDDDEPHPQHTHPRRRAFLGETVRKGVEGVGTAVRLVTLPPDPSSPLKGPLGIEKHAAWISGMQVDQVKAVGRRHGATVNDVLLSVVAGALGSYLRGRDCDVEQIRAMVPINVRPLDEPVPEDLGNAFSIVLLPLPVGVRDPVERLRKTKAEMDALKAGQDAAVGFVILQAMGAIPRVAEDQAVALFAAKTSLVATNVPGPRKPVRFAGHPVSGLMFWVPQAGKLGVGVSIISYAGEIIVGVAADRALVPELEPFLDAFRSELAALEDA
jgi:WS/DGAT/MGAT family acyltransferase